jgi:hypothetical protein
VCPLAGNRTTIICQNENGPCPAIAIGNILSLRGLLKLPSDEQHITWSELQEHLRGNLDRLNPAAKSDKDLAKNVDDVKALLPKLQKGLDVNVRFASPTAFEFTSQVCAA